VVEREEVFLADYSNGLPDMIDREVLGETVERGAIPWRLHSAEP
jgi:hypothetical protein